MKSRKNVSLGMAVTVTLKLDYRKAIKLCIDFYFMRNEFVLKPVIAADQ
ncbi:MAG TPA: hypothetical protein VLD38_05610 [Nitrosopumilaceae archaeon]|nr:hypothetical protein [Nitrosopumilaceae archaeon]